jgi:hypothetical protein
MATTLCRFDPRSGVGVSARFGEANQLAGALADADHAAAIAARDDGGFASVDALWARITLERLGSRVGELLAVNNPLQSLAAHDHETGSEFMRTLVTWL